MAYRAKFVPPGAKISGHYLGGSFPLNKARDSYYELQVRTAFAEALGMAAEDIPPIAWMIREWFIDQSPKLLCIAASLAFDV